MMLTNHFLAELSNELELEFGQPLGKTHWQEIGGGDINLCYQLTSEQNTYFVKFNNNKNAASMFNAEAMGLEKLNTCHSFCVPKPLLISQQGSWNILVLQYLPMQNGGDWQNFGKALADLHGINQSDYGLEIDNFIGTTPQSNKPFSDWAEFWWNNRLLPQLELCQINGLQELANRHDDLFKLNQQLLSNHQPTASLVHGDLWSGNAAFIQQGKPCIYDPACYFGDCETDLALTELFGGFPEEFYKGYKSVRKIEQAYSIRKYWYNLYHLLNHANLFGGHYPSACIQQIARIQEIVNGKG